MTLSIKAEWERLDTGPPEERACFAAVGIQAGDTWLTEAEDTFVKRVRTSVHLSAYKLAEWFAWNWWRQRWEPHATTSDWAMAHHMTTIGGGYVWPNITVISDGERIVVVAKPTGPREAEPLRYLADFAAVFRAVEFEQAVSRFIEQVQGQLRAENIATTNLDHLWSDVVAERKDQEAAKRRRLEALLGFEPDEADASLVERLVVEGADIGESAVLEMAALSSSVGNIPTPSDLREIAQAKGFDARPQDVVRLSRYAELPPIGDVPAWRRGSEAARALRQQEGLGASPISNQRLASMSGVEVGTVDARNGGAALSFALDSSASAGRVVLRSKWETGRRFELARLLGDRIASGGDGRLFPATRSYTYRQKLQRAFAAELLCPFDAVKDMLGGDYSEEQQEDVAEYFDVSPLTVRTVLVNHGLVDRDNFIGEPEAGMAA
jgi:hypothetical protein